MKLQIPIFISKTDAHNYTAKPVFFVEPVVNGINLSQVINDFERIIQSDITRILNENRHDSIFYLTFCPLIQTRRVNFTLELSDRVENIRSLLITFEHLGKKIALCPMIPEIWFELNLEDNLESRATEVYSEFFRYSEKSENPIDPSKLNIPSQYWIEMVDVQVKMPREKQQSIIISVFFDFDSFSKLKQSDPLEQVGYCLDRLYPHELSRAYLQEELVEELLKWLSGPIKRPVLLLGPRLVGKTTLVHEVVYRGQSQKHDSSSGQMGSIWHFSPQRLISGMQFVGQWERRLLDIIQKLSKSKQIMYFDNLLGLFTAGKSANSDLNIAMVIKPYLERQSIRFLGEITPDAWQILRELDRGFADLFHVIPVREPSPIDVLHIVLLVQRQLEKKYDCAFSTEVLSEVFDLQRRYNRETAFPGKAIQALQRMALRSREKPQRSDPYEPKGVVTRDDVYLDWKSQTGLSIEFLDSRLKLTYESLVQQLQKLVIGQSEAVEAIAEAISIAKAKLNDPTRPWASFLFLGPTGVGKTEMAKAATQVLLGDAKKMLRFDMNEYLESGAALKLVGSLQNPEGLLTSAVRRQPFSVILFDEIEKAHAEVFDLLLQVLGEGRLTDALGRTTDFTNCLIILTSNLGVREAENRLGLMGPNPNETRTSYMAIVEKFFRPEFVNRLDRIIPFQRLTRTQTAQIAKRLLNEVLNREGFRQRNVILEVTNKALERIIDSGYDPVLGARAMKRAIERELSQAAAVQLAELPVGAVKIVRVDESQQKLGVCVQGLEEVDPLPERVVPEASLRIERIQQQLDEFKEKIRQLRPSGSIGRNPTPEELRYISCSELVKEIEKSLEAFRESLDDSRLNALLNPDRKSAKRPPQRNVFKIKSKAHLRGLLGFVPKQSIIASILLQKSSADLFYSGEEILEDDPVKPLEWKMLLLNWTLTTPIEATVRTLEIHPFPEKAPSSAQEELKQIYLSSLTAELGLDIKALPESEDLVTRLEVSGFSTPYVLKGEVGTHLFRKNRSEIIPLRVTVQEEIQAQASSRPDAFDPIVRFYSDKEGIIDLRTGIISPNELPPESFAQIKYDALLREHATLLIHEPFADQPDTNEPE